jgi:transglutaminase-like putative cysteine protease
LRVNLSPRPATEPYYLRDIVLDTYSSAQGWSESDPVRDWPLADPLVREQLAGPPAGPPTGQLSGQLSGTAMSATIDVLELADSSAPTFAELTAIRGLGPSWRWDPTTATVSGGATRGASFYTVSWIQPQPTADQLRTAPPSVDPGLQRWLRLPDDVPAPVGDQARAIIAGKTTPFDEALALDQFFLDPANAFQYSTTTTTADTGDGLADFLISRRGFCQQYAAAMAVMARQVGLPTRIVLGYTHEAPGSDGTFLVTSHDAHAWVEIYFDGFGWVPFDPTPLTGADADRAVPLSYTGGPGSSDTPDGPSRTPGAATSGGPDATDVPVPDEVLSGTGPVRRAASAQSQRGPAALLVLGAARLILLAPGAARVAQRRGRARLARRTGQVWPWWEEFRAAAWDLGVTWSESATLREAPGAVAAALRAQGGAEGDLSALLELTRAAERERFGPVAAAPGGDRHAWRSTSARAAATGSAAVRNLRRSMGRPARIRARWLPASTLRPSAQRVGRAVQMVAAAPAAVLRRARRSAS